MKCPHCGKEHSDSAKFCENTGKELLKACPWEDCADYGKAILPMRAKFCPICGRPLQGNTEPSEQTFNVNGVEFKMIKVEGGTFSMGATSEQEYDAFSWEKPVHSVTLSDYHIGETEVTQELWEAVMGSNPSWFEGNDQRPVENVSWYDCQEFIKELNRLTGRNFDFRPKPSGSMQQEEASIAEDISIAAETMFMRWHGTGVIVAKQLTLLQLRKPTNLACMT